MEAGFIVLLILTAVICTMVGTLIGKRKSIRRDRHGVLNIDHGDPGGNPYLFLQLEVPIEEVVNLKEATFVVKVLK